MRLRSSLRCLISVCALSLLAAMQSAKCQETLYGGSGVGATDNVGALITIDQSDGSGAVVGTPDPGFGLSGISFNNLGLLYGTTVGGTGFASSLLLIDPSNGSLLLNVGTIKDGTQALKIGDLAFQPGSGTLYGITAGNGPSGSPGAGFLYTINVLTGAATLVGNTGSNVAGGLGFAPDGTLYSTSLSSLRILNPATGAAISSITTGTYFDALGVRSDGVIFVSPGNSGNTYTLNPTTGNATLLGNTLLDNAVSDLAFNTVLVPEPSSGVLLIVGISAIVWIARSRRV